MCISSRVFWTAALVIGGCGGSTFVGGDDAGTPAGDGGGGNLLRPSCPGQESTLSGKVLAPNGVDPVPGATVFIPADRPELFPPTVQCEVCGHLGSTINLWYTTSAYDGSFTLPLVCPGQRTLVFQNGRFRRLITVDVPAGGTLALSPAQTRLPRRNGEFDVADAVPRIAVATGDYDKMECELRKLGLEDGVVDLYEDAEELKSPKPIPPFEALVADLDKMKTYNIIFINCTAAVLGLSGKPAFTRPEVLQNITEYISAGGRFYVTDWAFDWIEQVPSLSPFIDFEPGPSGPTPEPPRGGALGQYGITVPGVVQDSAMAQWLGLFPGAISGTQVRIEHFLGNWVMMHSVDKEVKTWVDGPVDSGDGTIVQQVRPLTVTFNFKNCGKILYSSYHTEGRDDEIALLAPKAFPEYCTGESSPQDRILEYLIFDIASCVKPVE